MPHDAADLTDREAATDWRYGHPNAYHRQRAKSPRPPAETVPARSLPPAREAGTVRLLFTQSVIPPIGRGGKPLQLAALTLRRGSQWISRGTGSGMLGGLSGVVRKRMARRPKPLGPISVGGTPLSFPATTPAPQG